MVPEPVPPLVTEAKKKPTRYFGNAELDPVKASLGFSRIVSEMVELFSGTPGTKVRIRVDIEAEDERGFSEGAVRAVKEDSRLLGLKTSDFDS